MIKEVKFTEMKNGDKEDYDLLAKFEDKFIEGTSERLIRVLKSLRVFKEKNSFKCNDLLVIIY